jgi:hypothetical protein
MKMDDLSRSPWPINRALYRDKIAKSGDFLSVFFEKVVIHKDFGTINIS